MHYAVVFTPIIKSEVGVNVAHWMLWIFHVSVALEFFRMTQSAACPFCFTATLLFLQVNSELPIGNSFPPVQKMKVLTRY